MFALIGIALAGLAALFLFRPGGPGAVQNARKPAEKPSILETLGFKVGGVTLAGGIAAAKAGAGSLIGIISGTGGGVTAAGTATLPVIGPSVAPFAAAPISAAAPAVTTAPVAGSATAGGATVSATLTGIGLVAIPITLGLTTMFSKKAENEAQRAAAFSVVEANRAGIVAALSRLPLPTVGFDAYMRALDPVIHVSISALAQAGGRTTNSYPEFGGPLATALRLAPADTHTLYWEALDEFAFTGTRVMTINRTPIPPVESLRPFLGNATLVVRDGLPVPWSGRTDPVPKIWILWIAWHTPLVIRTWTLEMRRAPSSMGLFVK